MFMAHESTRMDFFGLFGEGYSHWRLIERSLYAPWFQMSIKILMDGEESSRVLMPGDESMLEHVLAQQNEEMQVTDLQVVTPAWINGQERWMMERLMKLEAGYDANDSLIHVITVESGAAYCTSHGAHCVAANLKGARVIYHRESCTPYVCSAGC